uniref:Uncharacterized protein n=1 Tax=Salvator merianae TaxID=96440 RepID=A0A8D0BKP2_SALMN
MGQPLKTVWKMELVQKAAVRLLTGVLGWTHITLVLKELPWYQFPTSLVRDSYRGCSMVRRRMKREA